MIIEWMFNEVIVSIINKVNIIPSRHRSVDMRCERNIRVPINENTNANVILNRVVVMLVIMRYVII